MVQEFSEYFHSFIKNCYPHPMNHSLKIFKAQRALYFVSELKSWVWTLLIYSSIINGFSMFRPVTNDKVEFSLILIVFAKLLSTLMEFRIKNITVNSEKKNIEIKSGSMFSGEKIRIYDLKNVQSEIAINNKWKRFFDSRFTLNLFISPKGQYKISSRYGFPDEDLQKLKKTLEKFEFR
ncbi:MAG: hypothetical protein C5B52_06555 [Bacteroidetes bacterium]|nr:MAG: hypothetical protein C5B52_06555 [Bacteroidota bacterium]